MYLVTCIADSIYCDVLPDILHTASVSIDTNRMGLVGPQITEHTLTLKIPPCNEIQMGASILCNGTLPILVIHIYGPQIYTSVCYLFVKMP